MLIKGNFFRLKFTYISYFCNFAPCNGQKCVSFDLCIGQLLYEFDRCNGHNTTVE